MDRSVGVERESQPHRRLMHRAVRGGVGAADGASLNLLPGELGNVLPASGGPDALGVRVVLVLIVAGAGRGDPAA